jgi:hypothetical protein
MTAEKAMRDATDTEADSAPACEGDSGIIAPGEQRSRHTCNSAVYVGLEGRTRRRYVPDVFAVEIFSARRLQIFIHSFQSVANRF